jgi:hypothetical protein
MTSIATVSFGVFAECIASADGNTDMFKKLMLERTGTNQTVTVVDHGEKCFTFDVTDENPNLSVAHMDAYADELDTWL